VGKGARALAAEPLADASSPAVQAALRAKHPAAPPPAPLECDVPALQVSGEVLERTLERIAAKRGVAAGPSGWTYQHIVVLARHSDRAFSAALAFVNLVLSGELPRSETLLDSLLIGLQKPDGGVRPIAVGEAWYRLAMLCAAIAVAETGRALAPLQLGVGVSGGTEALAHAVRTALDADPLTVVISIDAANAFNSLDRSALFAAVRKRAPALLPVVTWAYGAATDLHIVRAPEGTPPVQSQCGVRQGDPLAALLFALTVQDALEDTRDAVPAATPLAYADDMCIVGRPAPAEQAFQRLSGAGGLGRAGLRVAVPKCGVHGGDPVVAAALAARRGIAHLPAGIVVLGAPVGCEAFVVDTVARVAAEVVAQVDQLMALPLAAQTQFVILRMSLARRMTHLLRSVPWARLASSMRRVEQAILSAVAAIFRLPCSAAAGPAGARMPACLELQQLTLALRHGGFGFRATTAVEADAAFLAGASRAQAAMLGDPDAPPTDPHPPSSFRPFDEAASRASLLTKWRAVFDEVGPACGLDAAARDLPADVVRDVLPQMQRAASRVVSDREGAAFLAGFDVNTDAGRRGAARMRSAASGPASAFLTAVPCTPGLTLNDADFVIGGGRHRLGLGVPVGIPAPPCVCGAGCAGTPDHAMICRRCNGMMSVRHNFSVSTWRGILSDSGCPTSMEPGYAEFREHGEHGNAGMKRGDIFAVMPDGRLVITDIVITHPSAPTYVGAASRAAGAAAKVAERTKRRAFEALGEGAGYDFVPLAMESYGRLGKTALAFLSDLGTAAASRNGRLSKSAFVASALKRLSCALCKGNGRMYHASMFSLARAAGRQFMPGSDVPVVGDA